MSLVWEKKVFFCSRFLVISMLVKRFAGLLGVNLKKILRCWVKAVAVRIFGVASRLLLTQISHKQCEIVGFFPFIEIYAEIGDGA